MRSKPIVPAYRTLPCTSCEATGHGAAVRGLHDWAYERCRPCDGTGRAFAVPCSMCCEGEMTAADAPHYCSPGTVLCATCASDPDQHIDACPFASDRCAGDPDGSACSAACGHCGRCN